MFVTQRRRNVHLYVRLYVLAIVITIYCIVDICVYVVTELVDFAY